MPSSTFDNEPVYVTGGVGNTFEASIYNHHRILDGIICRSTDEEAHHDDSNNEYRYTLDSMDDLYYSDGYYNPLHTNTCEENDKLGYIYIKPIKCSLEPVSRSVGSLSKIDKYKVINRRTDFNGCCVYGIISNHNSIFVKECFVDKNRK